MTPVEPRRECTVIVAATGQPCTTHVVMEGGVWRCPVCDADRAKEQTRPVR